MKGLLLTLGALFFQLTGFSQSPESLPLFQMNQLKYQGAFRLPASEFGSSSLNYSEGPIGYNRDNHSLFIVGHAHHQAIAEFAIPALVISEDIYDLNMAGNPLQLFYTFLFATPDGNPQNLNRIGGMYYVGNLTPPMLVVNAYEYYDAPGDNLLTTMKISGCDDLANAIAGNYWSFAGGAGHTSGWISAIPAEWQSALEGTHITGQSSGIPIISRTSVGPAAFSFQLDSLLALDTGVVTTTKLLDFSLQNPLHADLDNSSGTNDLWTHLSRATYGFIVPETRSYLTLGYSGGHQSGVCYKCTQNSGYLCGGYCAPDTSDYYQSYWLWDLMNIMAVKNGELNAYEVQPYDYGEFVTPFQNGTKEIGGATFDEENQILYLSIQKADRAQGTYSNPPIILAYSINHSPVVDIDLQQDGISFYPNPTEGIFEISGSLAGYTLEIIDALGEVYRNMVVVSNFTSINITDLPDGIYLIRVKNKQNEQLWVEKVLKF